jgi:predicted nucleotidyltransferase
VVAILESKLESIAQMCARYGVVRLDAFGSALRDDFRPGESDIDLLVEFRPMDPFALADSYFGLLDALRSVIGTDIDLVMADALKNRYIAADIERSKQALYAA